MIYYDGKVSQDGEEEKKPSPCWIGTLDLYRFTTTMNRTNLRPVVCYLSHGKQYLFYFRGHQRAGKWKFQLCQRNILSNCWKKWTLKLYPLLKMGKNLLSVVMHNSIISSPPPPNNWLHHLIWKRARSCYIQVEQLYLWISQNTLQNEKFTLKSYKWKFYLFRRC